MKDKNQMPITISVYEIDNISGMDITNFISLVEILEKKVVFRTEDFFFVVVEGLSFGTWNYYYEAYSEFLSFYKMLEESSLEEPNEKLRAFILKIKNVNDFKDFLNTDFHVEYSDNYLELQKYYEHYQEENEGRFEMFLDAKSKEFIKISQYNKAIKCGIPTYNDYIEFKKSDFYSNYPDKNDYKDFLKFKEGDFPNETTFREAKNYGFDNYNEYKYFEKSGCYDKEEYDEYFKALYHIPDLNEKQLEKFIDLIKDTKGAFNEAQYGEFFRLKYIFFDQLIEILYKRICNKIIESDKQLIEDIVKEIKERIGAKFVKYQELIEWRKIRNKFSHEHYVIDNVQAKNAKSFFNTLILDILEQINNYLTKNDV